MKRLEPADILDVLACDISARPAAPGSHDLLPVVAGVIRMADTLELRVEPWAEAMLEQFVEAERLCCAGLEWQIERDPELTLRITASAPQLDALEVLFGAA